MHNTYYYDSYDNHYHYWNLKKFLIPNTYMLDKLCYDMKYKIICISSLYFTFWKSLHKIS